MPCPFFAENFVLMWKRIDPRSGAETWVAMDKNIVQSDPRISASIKQGEAKWLKRCCKM